jgi:hypothetical protein
MFRAITDDETEELRKKRAASQFKARWQTSGEQATHTTYCVGFVGPGEDGNRLYFVSVCLGLHNGLNLNNMAALL